MKIQSILSRIDTGVSIENGVKFRTADAAANGLDQSWGVKGSSGRR